LKAKIAEQELQSIFDLMLPYLDTITAVGRIKEMP
jgi:hypothetical protein